MSRQENQKRRGVQLASEAREVLLAELIRRHQSEEKDSRLTREARAEALGVSVPTADRILAGKVVDRTTLIHAFGSLGLEWSDSFCDLPKDGDEEAGASMCSPEKLVAPQPDTKRLTAYQRLLAGALAVATLYSAWIGAAALYRRHFGYSPEGEFNSALETATHAYHAGNYGLARAEISRAVHMAKEFHSTDRLSFALRIAGDLAAEQGDFTEGKRLYLEAIRLRESVDEKEYEPSIYEALGDLETRSGDLNSAEQHLLTARVGYEKLRDPNGVAMCERDLGSICLLKKDLVAARMWLTAASARVHGSGAADLLADIRARSALVDCGSRGFRRARSELQACLAHWQRRGHARWVAQTRYQLGTVEQVSGNQRLARQLLTESRDGFLSVGDRYGVKECERRLQDLKR